MKHDSISKRSGSLFDALLCVVIHFCFSFIRFKHKFRLLFFLQLRLYVYMISCLLWHSLRYAQFNVVYNLNRIKRNRKHSHMHALHTHGCSWKIETSKLVKYIHILDYYYYTHVSACARVRATFSVAISTAFVFYPFIWICLGRVRYNLRSKKLLVKFCACKMRVCVWVCVQVLKLSNPNVCAVALILADCEFCHSILLNYVEVALTSGYDLLTITILHLVCLVLVYVVCTFEFVCLCIRRACLIQRILLERTITRVVNKCSQCLSLQNDNCEKVCVFRISVQ